MSFLSVIDNCFGNGLLKKAGDSFSAYITPAGRQVIKVATSEIRTSVTRYPETGTQVITQVIKPK